MANASHPVQERIDEPFTLDGPGPVACLLFHGFAGSAAQMRPFAEHLNARGFPCAAPLLAGHGTTSRDLVEVTAEEWMASAESAYLKAAREYPVVIVAHSMGGVLALHLAARHPVAALVLMATPIHMWPGARPVISLMGLFSPFLASPHFGLLQSGKDHQVVGYPDAPASSVLEFLRLLDLVRPDLHHVSAPTLIYQSYFDYVVPFPNAAAIKSRLGSRVVEVRYLAKTLHLPHLDQEREAVFTESAEFLTAHASPPSE